MVAVCRVIDSFGIWKMKIGRKKGRILAFQALCAFMGGSALEDVLNYTWLSNKEKSGLEEDDFYFPSLLLNGTIENLEEIDLKIQSKLENWDFSRINYLDKANLRLSTYSLLYQPDIPPAVVINEAINIAKQFSTDESYKFVNAVLDGIKNSR